MNAQQQDTAYNSAAAPDTSLLTTEEMLKPTRFELTHQIMAQDGRPVQGELEICFLGEKFTLHAGGIREFREVSLHFSFSLTDDRWGPGLSVNVEEVAGLQTNRPGLRTIPLALRQGNYEIQGNGLLRLAAPADIEIALLGVDCGSSLTGDLRMRIMGETGRKLKAFLGDWLQKTEHVQIRTAGGGD